MKKHALLLGITLASSIALVSGAAVAAGGSHGALSSENPHANSGCASKKGKVAQFHRFHRKDGKMAHAEKKVDLKAMKKARELRNSI